MVIRPVIVALALFVPGLAVGAVSVGANRVGTLLPAPTATVPELSVERVTFRPGEIRVAVRNTGPAATTVSQVAQMMLERTLLQLPPAPPGVRPGRRNPPTEVLSELLRSFPQGADSLPEW